MENNARRVTYMHCTKHGTVPPERTLKGGDIENELQALLLDTMSNVCI
jgi:hypothetical protein